MVPIHFMVKQRDKGVWSLMKRMKKSDLKDPKKSEYMRKFYRTHKDYFTNYNREYYKKRKNELKNKQELTLKGLLIPHSPAPIQYSIDYLTGTMVIHCPIVCSVSQFLEEGLETFN